MAAILRVFIDVGDTGLAARLSEDLQRAGWAVTSRADDADLVLRPVNAGVRPVGAASRRDEADEPPLEALTPREHDVLMLLADGAGNRAIAERLGISDHTVKFHLSAIFGKLGVTTRTAAVRRALRLGWVET